MQGRIALVTGGSRGIGAAIVARLRASGALVLAPPRAELDLGSSASIDGFLRGLDTPVDILVNAAGINRLGGWQVASGDLEETLQVNLVGPMRLSAALAQPMVARQWGRILNISSIWSLVNRPRRVAYAASKAGLNGLTRALALELAPSGVLVNAIAPGFIDTALTRTNNSPAEVAALEREIPMGRLGRPEEVAELAAFLCSERNGYVTGQVIAIDGGWLCR